MSRRTIEIVVAPDGQNVAVVSRPYSRDPGGAYLFQAGATGTARQIENALDVAYHPLLPIIAASEGAGIRFYDRRTYGAIDSLATLPAGTCSSLMFTPSGTHLLGVMKSDRGSSGVLHSLKLDLDLEQLVAIQDGQE